MARTQPGRPTCSRSSREDLLLHLELLEDRLEHEVAVGEVLVAGRAGDERGQEAGLALVVAALGDLLRRARTRCSRARSRPRLVADVAHRDRHLEAPEEERGELRRHQARRRRSRPCGRASASRPACPAGSSRGARRGRRRRATPAPGGREAARRSPPPRRGSPPRASSPSRRPRSGRARVYGAGAAPWTARPAVRAPFGARPLRPGPGDCPWDLPLRTSSQAKAIDSSTNSAGSSRRSAKPSSNASGAGQHPVLAHRVLDDELHRRLGADQPRHELRPAPGRDDPEEALREAEVAHGGRDRARVAVERELDARRRGRRR